MVDEVLAATGRVQRRLRLLPARVVMYLALAGCLFAELGYPQVWLQLVAGLSGLALAELTSSALRQARQRLGPAPLRALFDPIRPLLGQPSVAGSRPVCGYDKRPS